MSIQLLLIGGLDLMILGSIGLIYFFNNKKHKNDRIINLK